MGEQCGIVTYEFKSSQKKPVIQLEVDLPNYA